ncbi:MAG: hypothetical protein RRY29_06230 [Desulfovibrionaceae bacterium]
MEVAFLRQSIHEIDDFIWSSAQARCIRLWSVRRALGFFGNQLARYHAVVRHTELAVRDSRWNFHTHIE